MPSVYKTNIRNIELGVMNILGLTPLEADIDLRFFVMEAMKDVLSRGNFHDVEKQYVVGPDNTIQLDDSVVGVYLIRNVDENDWEVVPGKIIFKKDYSGKTVTVFGAFLYIDDECEIPLFEYQEKAIMFRAAYMLAMTVPQRYSSVLPFLQAQQAMYCRSAASVSTYHNFRKKRLELMKIANRFIFN